MKKHVSAVIVIALISVVGPRAFARQSGSRPANSAESIEPQTIPLWDNGAPGALGHEVDDIPAVIYYPPARAVHTAVIVAPGGAYRGWGANDEGRQVANWLNAMGISAFVLRYRRGPRYHHPIELGDAQRAIRLVRARAADFGVQPNRVGMMGFSAGGHLAATAETHFDAGNPKSPDPIDGVSSRPDFAVLCYAVITFLPPYAHSGSIHWLLGDSPDPSLLRELSNELHVTPQTPPTFLFTTSADSGVPAENSVQFYLALHQAHVPAELHIFQKGEHGVALALGDPALGEWSKLLINWFRGLGLLED